MTSLDQLVIEHIEKSSGVELPQEEQERVIGVVSKLGEYQTLVKALAIADLYVIFIKYNSPDFIRSIFIENLEFERLFFIHEKQILRFLEGFVKLYSSAPEVVNQGEKNQELLDLIKSQVKQISSLASSMHPDWEDDDDGKSYYHKVDETLDFLSRQDSKRKTLREIFDQMIDCTKTEIPDYTLVDFLGQGAFKKVYLARSKIDPEKYVAVAVFDPEHIKKTGQLQLSKIGNTLTPEALEKAIKREFQPSKLDKIKHSHKQDVVNIHHVGRTEKFAYMIYEPYDINLRDFIPKERQTNYNKLKDLNPSKFLDVLKEGNNGPTYIIFRDYDEVKKILINIASGLAGCHEVGIIHRDLHAGNIGLHVDGNKVDRVILTDFGQMSEFSFEQDDENHSTISPLQTRSPEQFLSKDDFERYKQANVNKFSKGCNLDFELQKRTNIFNFGCIAYQIITGRVPFWPTNPDGTLVEDPLSKDSRNVAARDELEQRIHQIMETEKDSKGSYKRFLEKDPAFKKAPRDLKKIITKCLMYDPVHRYRSGVDLYKSMLAKRPYFYIGYGLLSLILAFGITLPFYRILRDKYNKLNDAVQKNEQTISQLTDINAFQISKLVIEKDVLFSGDELGFDLKLAEPNKFFRWKSSAYVDYYIEIKINNYLSNIKSLNSEAQHRLTIPTNYADQNLFWHILFKEAGVKYLSLDTRIGMNAFRSQISKPIIVLDKHKTLSELSNVVKIIPDKLRKGCVYLQFNVNDVDFDINDIGIFINDKALFYPKALSDIGNNNSGVAQTEVMDWEKFVQYHQEHDDKFWPDFNLNEAHNKKIGIDLTNYGNNKENNKITIVKIKKSHEKFVNSNTDNKIGDQSIDYELRWCTKEFNLEEANHIIDIYPIVPSYVKVRDTILRKRDMVEFFVVCAYRRENGEIVLSQNISNCQWRVRYKGKIDNVIDPYVSDGSQNFKLPFVWSPGKYEVELSVIDPTTRRKYTRYCEIEGLQGVINEPNNTDLAIFVENATRQIAEQTSTSEFISINEGHKIILELSGLIKQDDIAIDLDYGDGTKINEIYYINNPNNLTRVEHTYEKFGVYHLELIINKNSSSPTRKHKIIFVEPPK